MKTVKIQGVLVSVDGVGVLIRGPAGSGKSLAALNLLRRGHQLVADDLVEIFSHPDTDALTGRAVEEQVRIEVRGLGLFVAETLFPQGTRRSARMDFVVDLDRYYPSKDLGRTSPETGKVRILDNELLAVRVPVATGMDPALLIEILARAFKNNRMVWIA